VLVQADIRNTELLGRVIRGVEATIHLAAIVGEAACNLSVAAATEINFVATRELAALCRKFHVRLLFASTSSVYGANSAGTLREDSPIYPLSVYALSKVAAEEAIMRVCPDSLIFRLGTLYGLSPRMRFDLVMNKFVAQAIEDKKLTVLGGPQVRPFIHVRDVAEAFSAGLTSDVTGVLNLGGVNMTILDVAQKIQREVPCDVITYGEIRDPRNYAVDSGLAAELLGIGLAPRIEEAVEEIKNAYGAGAIRSYHDRQHSNEESLRGRVLEYPLGRVSLATSS
jgi:nucleoside-diphosphate-sugar epimerase